MKRVALYGGSFDPPHIGHIMNITAVINSQLADEVWLVPTGRHRFKHNRAPAEHRKTMVAIMLSTVFGAGAPVFMDTTEIDRHWIPSTTIHLIEQLRARHPECEFAVVIGADLIEQIPYWARGADLLATTPFLVVPRLGVTIPSALPPTMRVIPTEYHTDVSSSTIREMIARDMHLEGLVPSGVLSYIRRQGLYREITAAPKEREIIVEGKYQRFVVAGGWEYIERTNCSGIVVIIAETARGEILLTEQYRPPLGAPVIALPAGLAGDHGQPESLEAAARRELLEETGYTAEHFEPLITGTVSPASTSDLISFYTAKNAQPIQPGGGDAEENIIPHAVPKDTVQAWIQEQQRLGKIIDLKVYAGLFFHSLKREA